MRFDKAGGRRRFIRDYSGKSFRNPLFRRPGAFARQSSWGRRLLALALSGFVVAAGWLLLFSSWLRIDKIDVSGNSRIADWEIRDAVKSVMSGRLWLFLPKDNILVLSEDELVGKLSDQFGLESAEVVKKPPHEISVGVRERVSTIVLRTADGNQALLDLDGTIVRPLGTVDSSSGTASAEPPLPLLYDDRADALKIRQRAVQPEAVAAAIAAPAAMKEAFGSDVGLAETHVDGADSRTLRLVTSEGWSIYVDAAQPLKKQLDNALLVLKNEVGDSRKNLDYLDVRYSEKIFYKLKQ